MATKKECARDSCPAPPTSRVSPSAAIIAAKAKPPSCSQKSWPSASKVPSASGKRATRASSPAREISESRPERAWATAASAALSRLLVATSDTGGLTGAEEPSRAHQQHGHHHDVGHHLVEAASEEGEVRLVAGGEHLGHADDQPADDGAAGRVEAAEDGRGEGAQGHVAAGRVQPA